jgi:hypothetical protein
MITKQEEIELRFKFETGKCPVSLKLSPLGNYKDPKMQEE